MLEHIWHSFDSYIDIIVAKWGQCNLDVNTQICHKKMYSSDPYMYITLWWRLHPRTRQTQTRFLKKYTIIIIIITIIIIIIREITVFWFFQYFDRNLSHSIDRKLRFHNMSLFWRWWCTESLKRWWWWLMKMTCSTMAQTVSLAFLSVLTVFL